MLEKRFGFLRHGWLPLLMSILLVGGFGMSTAQAQVTVVYDTTYVPLNHTMTTNGDSAKYLIKNLKLLETAAGDIQGGDKNTQDTLQIMPPANVQFVKDSVVTLTARQIGTTGIKFDTTGFFAAYGQTQTSLTSVRVKPIYGATNHVYYLAVRVATASTAHDTIVVTGLYLQSKVTAAKFDSTTAAINVVVDTMSAGLNIAGSAIIPLPGPVTQMTITNQPDAAQTAGKYISSAGTLGSASVDTANGIKVYFKDAVGNYTPYNSTVPTVTAVLSNTNAAGSGTVGNTSTVVWYGHNIAVDFGSLTYTKAEKITLKFTLSSKDTVRNNAVMTFVPGTMKNISVALVSGKSDTLTVDQTTQYTGTVTDQFFNPVLGASVALSEKTNHNGAFNGPFTTDGNGQIAVTFTPNKYYVGTDILQFADSASNVLQSRSILINPGAIGGLILDYASSASGSQLSEAIGAGVQVYARAFLRDSYGNPISASSATQVTFTISGKNGKNTALGTPALTSSITENQYPNTSKTAVGIAIPYTVSTNVYTGVAGALDRTSSKDSVLATMGSYTNTLTIQARSNVPATLKLFQSTGTDSSVVASNYVNALAFQDSVWDGYGNIVTAPTSSGATIAPTKSSYGMLLSTLGKVKFLRTADTTSADTLYPNAGLVTTVSIASYKTAGMDTLKTVAATSASVAKSAPIWVTPTTLAKLVITPHSDTLAIAGQKETFTVDKQDQYSNHIDWGVAGNLTVSAYKTAYYTSAKLDTSKLNPDIRSQLSALTADTVSSGHNRGGFVTHTYTSTGSSALASVGGSLDAQVPFTSYTAGADTQKIYVNLTGATNDTATIRSIPTGILKAFTAVFDTAASGYGGTGWKGNAGDSVKLVFTAQDSLTHRIYTYSLAGQTLTVNHTNLAVNATKDSTFYFSYSDKNGKFVKRSSGASLTDTVFVQGQAVFYLHKFWVDSANTVTLTGGGFTATSTYSLKWLPLSASGTGVGFWGATVSKDTLGPNDTFTFTVSPRDKYWNLNSTEQNIINVSSNQTGGFNIGSNPKVITGATTFTGTLTAATNPLYIYVFNGTSTSLYGQSKAIVIRNGPVVAKGDVSGNGTVTAFDAALVLDYVVGDTVLSSSALTAADVTGNGSVTALDASWILRKAAGDTSVHFASATLKGERFAVSVLPSSGTMALSGGQSGSEENLVNVPVAISDARNVNAVSMSLNVGQGATVEGVTSSLPKDWLFAYHVSQGVLKIAMAGTTPLSSGNVATIQFKLASQSAKANLTGSTVINENEAQSLASFEVAAVPSKFGLDQNYPNPFNPTTMIKYQLAKPANVTLKIYNVTGQLVRTLVNDNQNAGYYTIQWNGLNNAGEQVSSGVYFFRLEAGSFVSFKKMLLLK